MDAELEFLESAERCCDHAVSHLLQRSVQYVLDHPDLLEVDAELHADPRAWFDCWCEREGITEAVQILQNAATETLRLRLEQIGARMAARRGKVQ